jgi:hypothetical protein
MKFRYAVSFESDTLPVETFRGEVESADIADAVRRAVFRAENDRPNKRLRFRSVVVVVEEFAAARQKRTNEIKGPREDASPDGPILDA